jgi:hypothetical protein
VRACVRACASARMSVHLRRTLTSRPRAATSVAISTFLCPDLNMCSAASRSCCHNQAKTHITKIAQHGTGRLRVGWSTSSSQRRGKQLLRQSIRGIESAVGPKAPLWAHRPGQARSVSRLRCNADATGTAKRTNAMAAAGNRKIQTRDTGPGSGPGPATCLRGSRRSSGRAPWCARACHT